jgi:UDP:flavonoid glycosyltransferase YjiC (YdhE family)
VRILVTTNAAIGHFMPMAPTVAALVAAGHDVRVGCPASFAVTVQRAGFAPMACRDEPVTADVPPYPRPEDRDGRLRWAIMLSWPSDARPWVRDLLKQAKGWRPDVVVVEPLEHAGRVVAAALGAPLVEHGWGFTLPAGTTDAATEGLLDLYDDVGASPAQAVLSVDLGSLSVQAADIPPTFRYRYQPWSQPGQPLPAGDGRPRVLVTLGTYDNPDAAHRIRLVVAAVHDVGAQPIAVLGNADRHAGDDFPAGAAALDWVDMPAAVAGCDLVIHHGGAGTSWATLTACRAAIVTPQAGDQFRNAELLTRAGLAITVDPYDLDTAAIGAAVEQALGSTAFADRAAVVAAENAALPDAAQLAADIAFAHK